MEYGHPELLVLESPLSNYHSWLEERKLYSEKNFGEWEAASLANASPSRKPKTTMIFSFTKFGYFLGTAVAKLLILVTYLYIVIDLYFVFLSAYSISPWLFVDLYTKYVYIFATYSVMSLSLITYLFHIKQWILRYDMQ